MKVKFCWLCGNKLYGNHKELLVIDYHERTLHKQCAKTIKEELDYSKKEDGYHSVMWDLSGGNRD
jgi:hypothetical protein